MRIQRKAYEDNVRRIRTQQRQGSEEQIPELQVKAPQTDSEKLVQQFEMESLDGQSVSDILNYLTSKFETTMDEHCTHLLEKEWKVQA